MFAQTTDILFDLGGVLIDLDTPAMEQACMRCGIDLRLFFIKATPDSSSSISQGVAASELLQDYQIGVISTRQLMERIVHYCPNGIRTEQVTEAWNTCLGSIPQARLDLIRQLRQQGYRTHLLSNTNDLHWHYIEQHYFSQKGYTCSDLFDYLFLSHEIHLAKPDMAIYRHVIETLGVPSEQLFFIDDTEINTKAAESAGIRSYWLDLQKEDLLTANLF